jgi:hypothetical protein
VLHPVEVDLGGAAVRRTAADERHLRPEKAYVTLAPV